MCLLLHLLLLCHQLQQVTAAGSEARVVNPTTGFTGGVSALRPISDSAPKPSGSRHQARCLARRSRGMSSALLTCLSERTSPRLHYIPWTTTGQVPHQLRSFILISQYIPQRPAPPTVRQGLRVFCWNAGGLGGGLYAELMTFLTNSQYDAAIILDSKWQENME